MLLSLAEGLKAYPAYRVGAANLFTLQHNFRDSICLSQGHRRSGEIGGRN